MKAAGVARRVRVLGNEIVDVAGSPGLNGDGICVSATDARVVGNRITSTGIGVYFSPTARGKYRDNLTTDVTVPYSGGTDAGNND